MWLIFFCCVCDMFRGPPRFEGDRPRFGDRDGYRGGPRGAPGDSGGDKGGAPAEFQPSFRVINCICLTQSFFPLISDTDMILKYQISPP